MGLTIHGPSAVHLFLAAHMLSSCGCSSVPPPLSSASNHSLLQQHKMKTPPALPNTLQVTIRDDLPEIPPGAGCPVTTPPRRGAIAHEQFYRHYGILWPKEATKRRASAMFVWLH